MIYEKPFYDFLKHLNIIFINSFIYIYLQIIIIIIYNFNCHY